MARTTKESKSNNRGDRMTTEMHKVWLEAENMTETIARWAHACRRFAKITNQELDAEFLENTANAGYGLISQMKKTVEDLLDVRHPKTE